jgi:hypothetical protein
MVEQGHTAQAHEAVVASHDAIMSSWRTNPNIDLARFLPLSLSLSLVAAHSAHSLIDISVIRFFPI